MYTERDTQTDIERPKESSPGLFPSRHCNLGKMYASFVESADGSAQVYPKYKYLIVEPQEFDLKKWLRALPRREHSSTRQQQQPAPAPNSILRGAEQPANRPRMRREAAPPACQSLGVSMSAPVGLVDSANTARQRE